MALMPERGRGALWGERASTSVEAITPSNSSPTALLLPFDEGRCGVAGALPTSRAEG